MDSYKLSALGIEPGHDPQAVKAKLQPMLKGEPSVFDNLFHHIARNEPVVLGENIPRDKAKNLLEKLTAIGLKCRIDPMALSLVSVEEEEQHDVYRCPACGHCQPPARGNLLDTCERCGVVGQNYQEANEIRQALELERRRLRSVMEEEKKRKLEAAEAKANKRREKIQQKFSDRAQRQVQGEVETGPWDKLKTPLQPDALYLIVGSVTVALIGIGLLVWQLRGG